MPSIRLGIHIGRRRGAASGASAPAAPTLTAPTATNPSPDAVLANGEVSIALSATAEAGLSALRWYAYPDGSAWDGPGAVQLGEDTDGGDTSYADTLAILDLDLASEGHDWHIVAVAHGPTGSTPSTPVAVTVERLTLVRDYTLSDSTYTFPVNYWRAVGTGVGTRYGYRVVGRGNGAGGTASSGGGGGGAATFLDAVGTSGAMIAVAGIAQTAAATSAGDVTWGSTTLVADGGLRQADGGTGGLAANCTPSANAKTGGTGVADGGTVAGGGSAGLATDASGAAPGEPSGAAGISNILGSHWFGAGGGSTSGGAAAGSPGVIEVNYYTTAPRGFPRILSESINRRTSNGTTITTTLPAVSHVASDGLGRLLRLFSIDGATTVSATDYAALTAGSDGSDVTIACLHKEADGADATLATLSASEQCCERALRIVAYDGTVPEEPTWTTVGSGGNTTTPNAPLHTPPAGEDDYLWLIANASDGLAGARAAGFPENTGVQQQIPPFDANGAMLQSCARHLRASSLDPVSSFATGNDQAATATLSLRN